MTNPLRRHPPWLPLLLGAFATVAGAEPTNPAAPVAEPDLSSLAAPPEIVAAGEAASGNRRLENMITVHVDGESIPLEEREIRLEGTAMRSLYRQGPMHEQK